MVHYRKQLWGVFHYVVLWVLRTVTVGHITCGRLPVPEYVFPDVRHVHIFLHWGLFDHSSSRTVALLRRDSD